jgi:hypothetical protein
VTLAASGWTVMHRWSEADGGVLEGLGLGLVLEGLGLGLGLVLALGLGLGEVVLGVGDGLAEALEDALVLGLAVALVTALEDALALEEGVALALLTDMAVSWAAHGFAAASAGAALAVRKIPVRPARRLRNPEIMPNAPIAARRLLMDTSSPPSSSPIQVAIVAMVRPVNAG